MRRSSGKATMKKRTRDTGVSLIEAVIAVLVAMLVIVSLGNVVFRATATNKNQGAETTRAVIYAQDKLEKLLSLGVPGAISTTAANFLTCTQAAASQPTVCNMTGVTDSGWTKGLLAGGPIVSTTTTTSPVAFNCPNVSSADHGYVDFLTADGIQITGTCSSISGANVAYIREWTISDVTTGFGGPTFKQITVAVYSVLAVNIGAGKPIVVMTSTLSNPN